MTSPDLRPYVDLTIYDVDLLGLIDRAVTDAAAKFPGWVPREGLTEMVLIEALALVTAEGVYALNRLPGAIVEILLQLYGITRSLGAPPTASVTFSLADALGHEIPAGTRVRLDLGAGVEPVVFTTDELATAAPGFDNVTVAVTATSNTARADGVAAGTAVVVLDPIAFVDSAEIAVAPVAGGAEPEDVDAWLTRGMQVFDRLTSVLVLPQHFTDAAVATTGVYRATAVNNWDPTAGGGAGATVLGHVTVAVLGQGGVALSSPAKAAIEAALEAAAQVNLAVHVVDPTITTVAVTTTVMRKAGYSNTEVSNAVTAALGAYLDPDTWPWAGTVRRNELLALIDGVAGVDYVVSLTAPASDVALTGVAPLADLGALAVTVNEPA